MSEKVLSDAVYANSQLVCLPRQQLLWKMLRWEEAPRRPSPSHRRTRRGLYTKHGEKTRELRLRAYGVTTTTHCSCCMRPSALPS